MVNSHILFITTANIASNPRLVKSYIYWRSQGVECTILSFSLGNWSDDLNLQLIQKHNLKIIQIPASKDHFLDWLLASIVQKVFGYFFPPLKSVKGIAFASNKRSFQLIKKLKKLKLNFTKIEAHTLGSLYPAYNFSRKMKIPFDFDVEDYHPEEKIYFNEDREKKRRLLLLKRILPFANKITAASPQIASLVENLIEQKVICINNSFFENEFKVPEVDMDDMKIKLVWFSITISYGRGLEEFIEASQEYRDYIRLDLIGNLDTKFNEEYILPNSDFIRIVKPMNQEELHKSLSQYDIGLALEMVKTDFNRNICLTNKLFAFAQAGLFIFATDTFAQKKFMLDNSILGTLCEQTAPAMKLKLKDLIDQKSMLRNEMPNRFSYSKKFAFENEMEKLQKF